MADNSIDVLTKKLDSIQKQSDLVTKAIIEIDEKTSKLRKQIEVIKSEILATKEFLQKVLKAR